MSERPNKPDCNLREFVSFRIGAQEFCIDVMSVREIRGWIEATPLPHTPDYVLGMINLRGVILPVADMALRLGLPAGPNSGRRVTIVVCVGQKLMGLLVDDVCDILAVPADRLQPPPEVASNTLEPFIDAVINVEDRMVCVIALERLLMDDHQVAA